MLLHSDVNTLSVTIVSTGFTLKRPGLLFIIHCGSFNFARDFVVSHFKGGCTLNDCMYLTVLNNVFI